MEAKFEYPKEFIIIQNDDTHRGRLVEFLEECVEGLHVFKQAPSLIFCTVPDAHAFVQWAFKHDALYRCVHRYFFIQHVLPSFSLEPFANAGLTDGKNCVLRVVAYPRATEQQICEQIPLDIEMHPKNFTNILCCVQLEGEWFLGLGPREYLFYPENAVHSVERGSAVSRAHYKLKEALERSKMDSLLTKSSICVDVGAAPGGISMYLADNCAKVYAIDPAELEITRPNIVHYKMKAQDAVALIEEPIDLLVCDMNIKPESCMDILKTFEPRLKTGAIIALTYKFMNRGGMNAKIEKANKYFAQTFPQCEVKKVYNLLANSSFERFLLAVKKAEASQSLIAASSH